MIINLNAYRHIQKQLLSLIIKCIKLVRDCKKVIVLDFQFSMQEYNF